MREKDGGKKMVEKMGKEMGDEGKEENEEKDGGKKMVEKMGKRWG